MQVFSPSSFSSSMYYTFSQKVDHHFRVADLQTWLQQKSIHIAQIK